MKLNRCMRLLLLGFFLIISQGMAFAIAADTNYNPINAVTDSSIYKTFSAAFQTYGHQILAFLMGPVARSVLLLSIVFTGVSLMVFKDVDKAKRTLIIVLVALGGLMIVPDVTSTLISNSIAPNIGTNTSLTYVRFLNYAGLLPLMQLLVKIIFGIVGLTVCIIYITWEFIRLAITKDMDHFKKTMVMATAGLIMLLSTVSYVEVLFEGAHNAIVNGNIG
jgi:type IV secretory pathway VirB2 component (pilin)